MTGFMIDYKQVMLSTREDPITLRILATMSVYPNISDLSLFLTYGSGLLTALPFLRDPSLS